MGTAVEMAAAMAMAKEVAAEMATAEEVAAEMATAEEVEVAAETAREAKTIVVEIGNEAVLNISQWINPPNSLINGRYTQTNTRNIGSAVLFVCICAIWR